MKKLLSIVTFVIYTLNFHYFNGELRKFKNYAISKQFFYKKIDKEIKHRVPSEKGSIVFLGDSIMLGLRNYEHDLSTRVENWAIAGDTSKLLLNRVLGYNLQGIEAIHLMVGVNDLGRNTPVEDVILNLSLIVDSLSLCQCDIFFYKVLYTDGVSRNNDTIRQLNSLIDDLADSKSVKVVDLNQLVSEGEELMFQYTDDGLHLNESGYGVWINKMIPK
jgi:lysophospholipase L1-like esterase